MPSTPSDFTGYSTGAEIWVDGAGRNVYVSNRGHDSIGVFGIDAAKGTLTPRQWVPTKGGVPRFFAFDPAERFLYVANQGGDSIIAYKVGRNGLLGADQAADARSAARPVSSSRAEGQPFLLEGLLAGFLDARQGHQEQQHGAS